MPNLYGSNNKKIWYTLSIIHSINPRGCPLQGTIPLGQAVCPGTTRIRVLFDGGSTYLFRNKIKNYCQGPHFRQMANFAWQKR